MAALEYLHLINKMLCNTQLKVIQNISTCLNKLCIYSTVTKIS